MPAMVPNRDRTPPSATGSPTPDGHRRNEPSHVQERGASDAIGQNAGKITRSRRMGRRYRGRFLPFCLRRRGGSCQSCDIRPRRLWR